METNTNYQQIDKCPLSEVVDCFKGKGISTLKSATPDGNIAVINVGDMTPLGIAYSQLKKVSLTERAAARYLLRTGDVLVASKGTVKKVAVFTEQAIPVIASFNITILRPKAQVSGAYISLFLQSSLGQELLKEADIGKSVINISTEKLLAIAIPLIPKVKQSYLVQRYEQGLRDYQRKLQRAEQEWHYIQNDVEKKLF